MTVVNADSERETVALLDWGEKHHKILNYNSQIVMSDKNAIKYIFR